jgi:hypothetical protein
MRLPGTCTAWWTSSSDKAVQETYKRETRGPTAALRPLDGYRPGRLPQEVLAVGHRHGRLYHTYVGTPLLYSVINRIADDLRQFGRGLGMVLRR